MKTKLCMLLCAVLMLGSLASCTKGTDPDTITRQAITGCCTLYKNTSTGASQSGASTSYTIEINYTKTTVDLTITGLSLPDGTSYPAVTLPNIPFKLNDDQLLTTNAITVQSSINGFSNSPVFSNVQLHLLHRNINDEYTPAFVLGYTVGSFEVKTLMPNNFLFGRTVSTGPDNAPYTCDETTYVITVASTMDKATITMGGAHFIEQMPAMDIELPDVPVSFDGLNLNINAQEVTPAIKGVPNPGFPITDLVSAIDITGKSSISFTCAPKTMQGVYKVTATLDPTGKSIAK